MKNFARVSWWDHNYTLCSYWSVNAHAEALQYAYPLYIGKDGINVNQKLPRCYGFSIRPVSD